MEDQYQSQLVDTYGRLLMIIVTEIIIIITTKKIIMITYAMNNYENISHIDSPTVHT